MTPLQNNKIKKSNTKNDWIETCVSKKKSGQNLNLEFIKTKH